MEENPSERPSKNALNLFYLFYPSEIAPENLAVAPENWAKSAI